MEEDERAELGHAFWPLLHKTARSLGEKPTYREKRRFREFLDSMGEIYPCGECRDGFEWVRRNPPDLSSRKAAVAWTCRFHNAVSEHLGKEQVDCEAYASGSNTKPCSACSRVKEAVIGAVQMDSKVMADATRLEGDHVPFDSPQAQTVVRALLDHESREYGVPAPRAVKFRRTDACPGTSCNIVTNPKRPAESTTFYFYRPEGFNLRSTLHEFYHYMSSILGPDAVKRKLGSAFQGDPDSEEEADRFAFAEISRLRLNSQPPSVKVSMDSTVENGNGTELVVREQALPGMPALPQIFGYLDGLYAPLVAFTHESAADINLQYTPAFLASGFGTAFEVIATPLGKFLLNGIAWGVLGAAATFANTGNFDRHFLNEWAAQHLSYLIGLANPANLAAVAGGAKALGSAAGRGNAMDVLYQVVRQPTEISAGFRAQLDAVQKVFSPYAQSGGGAAGGRAAQGGPGKIPTFQ